MPTFNDLYYAQIGYSQLKPEYSNQINLGATYTLSLPRRFVNQLSVQADAYYASITDKIIAAPTGSSFRWMMTNMGLVRSTGVETKVSAMASVRQITMHANLNYAFTRAQDYTKINGMPLSSYGDQIPYTPRHSGSVITGAEYKGWGLNYSFIYVGKRYNGAVNNIPRNEVQPWYTHDMSVQKLFVIKDRYRLKASVEMNNMLNQYYDVVLNYPMPGRNFKLIISLEL